MKQETAEKLKLSIFTSLLLSFTFFFFGPLDSYMANVHNFWFPIKDVFLVMGGTFLIAFIAIFLFSFLLQKLGKWGIALLFGLGMALYIQGNYLQKDYGILDGSEIVWSNFTKYGIFNTAIWLLIMAIPFLVLWKKPKVFDGLVKYGAGLVLGIQIITLVTVGLTTDLSKPQEGYVSTAEQFQLSKNKNVVVFVLDTLEIPMFDHILEEYPELGEQLEDFTYYDNTVAKYFATSLALPHMISGKGYLNEEPYEEYLESSYKDAQLFQYLEKENYDYGIYTDFRYVKGIENLTSLPINYEKADMKISSTISLSKLFSKFTATKYFPHYLKKFVWMDTSPFDSLQVPNNNINPYDSMNIMKTVPTGTDDPFFYSELQKYGIETSNDKNAFRFYHLWGAHGPTKYNANVEPVVDDSVYVYEQIKGSFKICSDYIEELKKQGIYDDTYILILADHGLHYDTREQAVLLEKKRGAHHEFKINHTPVSYDDLEENFLYVLTEGEKGVSLEQTKVREKREFNYYGKHTLIEGYHPTIETYETIGNIKEEGYKVISSGKQYNPAEILKYSLGEKLTFSEPEKGGYLYALEGITGPTNFPYGDREYSSSIGNYSLFHFNIEKSNTSDLTLTMKLLNFSNTESNQICNIYVNEEFIETIEILANEKEFKIEIPSNLITDGNLDIRFEYPDLNEEEYIQFIEMNIK